MNGARITLAAVFLIFASSAAHSETISEVKSSASNWMQVTIEGIVTYVEDDECYIEDPGRSGGIWVVGPTGGIEVGDPVIAFGTFSVISGEPVVLDASIFLHGRPSPINPFGMSNSAIGGASKWSPMWIWDFVSQRVLDGHSWIWRREWAPACGASNTGLLVKTWGTVRSNYQSAVNGARWFYLDDGSGPVSDFGDTGVLVYGGAEIEQGDYVAVTGISSTEPSYDDPSRLVRVIRTRGAGDVQWLAPRPPPPASYPFSDEFDSPALDPRWIELMALGSGSISVTERPGWLTLTPTMGWMGVSVGQIADGNWEMDVKLTADVSRNTQVDDQVFCIKAAYAPSYEGWWPAVPSPGAGANFHPASTDISVCGSDLGSVATATLYFRLRRSGECIQGSFSTDGIDYSQEVQGSYDGAAVVLGARAAYHGSPAPASTFKVHIDYIRFTPVDGGGAL